MKKKQIILSIIIFIVILFGFLSWSVLQQKKIIREKVQERYWLLLHRKTNKEFLYYGVSGDKTESRLIKIFIVKSGMQGERPTPLPSLLGRKYWIIVEKHEEKDNPETAPYFLTLDIPVSDEEPFGPTPYLECNGQCNWVLPGYFGLHGTGGDPTKLAKEDPGSSGCIRHKDEDITYLYQMLNPQKEEVRYYIEDI